MCTSNFHCDFFVWYSLSCYKSMWMKDWMKRIEQPVSVESHCRWDENGCWHNSASAMVIVLQWQAKTLLLSWLLKVFTASGGLKVLYFVFGWIFTVMHYYCSKAHGGHSKYHILLVKKKDFFFQSFSSMTFCLSCEALLSVKNKNIMFM